MNIFLLGYMASGKSTIGEPLSKVLGYDFLDLDAYIAQKEHKSIAEIFKAKGELYFRKREHEYLKTVLSLDNTVVALGGGTPCYANNMSFINQHSNAISIYLKVGIPTLVDRLMLEKDKRPLVSHLTDRAGMSEFVGKHLFERSGFYNQSDLILEVEGKSTTQIVSQIVANLF